MIISFRCLPALLDIDSFAAIGAPGRSRYARDTISSLTCPCAHLETRALLTSDQIALYEHLRGYGDPAGAPMQHHHG
jgi:hypothetical protein